MPRTDNPGLVSCSDLPGENGCMKHEEHLKIHLEICKVVCEQLRVEGNWPWADSQNSEDLVESDDADQNV